MWVGQKSCDGDRKSCDGGLTRFEFEDSEENLFASLRSMDWMNISDI